MLDGIYRIRVATEGSPGIAMVANGTFDGVAGGKWYTGHHAMKGGKVTGKLVCDRYRESSGAQQFVSERGRYVTTISGYDEGFTIDAWADGDRSKSLKIYAVRIANLG